MEFDARNNPGSAYNSRSQMESEKTLQQIRLEGEEEKQKILINNLNQYAALSKTLENQLKKLRLDDAQNLNYERERLERKYTDIQKKYNLSNYQTQLMLLRELKKKSGDYAIDNAKEELKAFSSNIRYMKKNQKAYMDERRKSIEDLRKVNDAQEKASQNKLSNLQARIDKSKSASYKKKLQKQLNAEKENLKKIQTQKAKLNEEDNKSFKDILQEQKEAKIQARKDIMESTLEKGGTKQDAYQARLEADPYDLEAQAMTKMNEALNSFVNGIKELLTSYIQEYSSYQGKVNARLQGSGSDWNSVNNRLNNSVGATPYVKLSKMLENVSAAVEAGIAYNVEQRAFLQTVSENIATTFNAFNANLLRIIRLQQNDSTAARMGLEASLTTLFNTYFSDTSYLSHTFDSVSANLTEAIAQMGTEEGVAFEYAVQKWLGSLYSVGMSDSAISSIATALGQLGSGDVSGLAGNSAMQNLIVMAASRAGLSYADMLTGGLTAETTNTLLASMVDYLQEIAESDNKVIKSQYSQIFGLTSADLVAAKNLGSTVASLAQNTLDYSGAVNELYYQMNQLPTRLSVGEMAGNLIDNVKYTLAQGIANNPVTYALWEMTDMVEGLSGGLWLPQVSIMGNSFDLKTSLTNLARLGIAGVGLLGNVGTIINGIGNTFNPSGMLTQLGITTNAASNAVTRGGGLGRRQSVTNQVSSSTTVGNTSGEDYEASLTAQAEDKGNAAVEAKQEEEQTKSINDIHEYLLQVFDPKITGITRMLGALSGFSVSEGTTWGTFRDQNDKTYAATSIKIENVGETNMASQNAEYMKKISDNVENIYTLLSKGELKVTVLNYGLAGGNTTTSSGGVGF